MNNKEANLTAHAIAMCQAVIDTDWERISYAEQGIRNAIAHLRKVASQSSAEQTLLELADAAEACLNEKAKKETSKVEGHTFLEELIGGLQIIQKYEPNAEIAAEHDIIYAGDWQSTWEAMTNEERQTMHDLGWVEEDESWAYYP